MENESELIENEISEGDLPSVSSDEIKLPEGDGSEFSERTERLIPLWSWDGVIASIADPNFIRPATIHLYEKSVIIAVCPDFEGSLSQEFGRGEFRILR